LDVLLLAGDEPHSRAGTGQLNCVEVTRRRAEALYVLFPGGGRRHADGLPSNALCRSSDHLGHAGACAREHDAFVAGKCGTEASEPSLQFARNVPLGVGRSHHAGDDLALPGFGEGQDRVAGRELWPAGTLQV
jgi:hypothetical protein